MTMTVRFLSLAALLCVTAAPAALAAKPEPARQTDPVLDRYGEAMLARYSAAGPGGAVLVARGDRVLFRGSRGEADASRHAELRPDSIFRLGSITKQFTAAGILKLVESGRLKLDDPLSKYVPDFPSGDGITIAQLLNHTSGVKNYTAIKGYMEDKVQRDLSTAGLIAAFKNERPDFAPGTAWNYSNSGYVLLGAVIEAVTGKPWHVYLDQTLFRPLGMHNTGYALDPRLAAKQVVGYSFDHGRLVRSRPISMTQPHAAGGLMSNVDDLLKWNRALHEGPVLTDASYARMITPVGPAADPAIGYGFGIFSSRVRTAKSLYHGGGIFGFVTALQYLPGPDITVAVLENDDEDNDEHGGDSADNFARRLAAIALGDPYPEMKPVAVPAERLRTAEGVYRFEGGVTRILRVVDGKLTAQRGPRGERIPLVPIAADDFLYPDGFNRLTLVRNSAGKVTGARIFPNGDGSGELGAPSGEALPALAPVALPLEVLRRFVGTYAHDEMSMKVYIDGTALAAQLAGQPPVSLKPTSTTSFQVQETPATLSFPDGSGPAAEATIRQGGRELVLKRVQ
jgi:CubicO group peptidase (beta-lactamase class C family)